MEKDFKSQNAIILNNSMIALCKLLENSFRYAYRYIQNKAIGTYIVYYIGTIIAI